METFISYHASSDNILFVRVSGFDGLCLDAYRRTETGRVCDTDINADVLGCCSHNDYCDSKDFSFFPEKRYGEAGLDSGIVSGMLQRYASVFSEHTDQL